MKTGTVFSDPALEILGFPIVYSLQPSAYSLTYGMPMDVFL